MSLETVETIILEPGAKVRRAPGEVVKLTEPATIVGELIPPTQQQKNRHKLIVCGDPACRAAQEASDDGLQKFRCSRSTCKADSADRPFPTCGICGTPMTFAPDTPEE